MIEINNLKVLILLGFMFASPLSIAKKNTIMQLSDEQFIKLMKGGFSDRCLDYYQGDAKDELINKTKTLQIVDGSSRTLTREATAEDKAKYVNDNLEKLASECKRNAEWDVAQMRGLGGLPKDIDHEDATKPEVIDRYIELIGYQRDNKKEVVTADDFKEE